MDPAHARAHQRLWTDLTRHAQPGYIAAPAALLAFTAWQNGNGALANLALDRALADTPGYSMALLLRDAIDAGAPPSVAVLPMTPEEVAASYSESPGAEQAEQANPGGFQHWRQPRHLNVPAATGPAHRAGPRWRGLRRVPTCQPRSRGRPRNWLLAPLAPPVQDLFPDAADPGTGYAGSFLKTAGKTSCPAGPASCTPALLRLRVLPHRNTPQIQTPPPGPSPKEHTMDATTTTPTQLITCDGCGTQVPSADTYYVDGAGQLCTPTCTSPLPEALVGIAPPF